MEFFAWCWIWDKRLLCGLNHGKAYIYIWLIPLMISIAVISYAAVYQWNSEEAPSECSKNEDIVSLASSLTTLVYIMQGIIFMQIFTSFGMIIKTR